jgi:hypothetical protein
MVFANFQNTRWIAVILSNDGEPNFPTMLTPQRDSSGTT